MIKTHKSIQMMMKGWMFIGLHKNLSTHIHTIKTQLINLYRIITKNNL